MSDGTMVAIFGALLAAGLGLFLWNATHKQTAARSKEQGRRDASRARLLRGSQADEPRTVRASQGQKGFGRR